MFHHSPLMKTENPDSNAEWKMWGDKDPLWAVTTWKDKDKTGINPWTDADFYELGRKDWSDFIKHWTSYGVIPSTAVEIGCGAGRLTKHMASVFGHIHALDISPGMIEYAKARVQEPNITFHLIDGESIPLPDESVTAVFSTHVFQHFDSINTASGYFKDIARTLVREGTMMIHLPMVIWPCVGHQRWLITFYRVLKSLENFNVRRKRRAIRGGGFAPLMCMNSYPVDYFYKVLPVLGFKDIEISIFATRSDNYPQPFLLGRKS